MKYFSTIILLFSFSTLFCQYDSLQWEGRTRYYMVHTPPSYNGSAKLSLIVALHGGFGKGSQLETQSKLSTTADVQNFIVVYPDGVGDPILNIRTWNAGGCCGYSKDKNIDDVGFINVLLDTLFKKYAIDTTKVFATGISNGAFLSYRLACELSHRFTAIAPVAGTMVNSSDCTPNKLPIPVIHFHSYQDNNIPYQGGIGSGASSHYNPPLDSVFSVWKNNNDCSSPDTVYNGVDYMHVVWDNCFCNTKMEFYITQDGGHSWHGGNKTAVGDPASTTISANDLMWQFFQNTGVNCPTQSINLPINQLKCFCTGKTLNIFAPYSSYAVEIIDITGKIVLKGFSNQSSYQTENISEGFYIVRISNQQGATLTKKVLVY